MLFLFIINYSKKVVKVILSSTEIREVMSHVKHAKKIPSQRDLLRGTYWAKLFLSWPIKNLYQLINPLDKLLIKCKLLMLLGMYQQPVSDITDYSFITATKMYNAWKTLGELQQQ